MRTNKDSLEGEGLNELVERFSRDETRRCWQDGVPSSICPLVASIKMSGRRQRTGRERWAPSVALRWIRTTASRQASSAISRRACSTAQRRASKDMIEESWKKNDTIKVLIPFLETASRPRCHEL